MNRRYRLHGYTVASPYPLGHTSAPAEVDITFTVGPAPPGVDHSEPLLGRRIAHLAADRLYYELVDQGGDGFVHRFHELVDVRITPDKREARCEILAGGDEAMMPVILAGNVISSMMLLRGDCVLHASAVERDGRAVALVGASGSGKSTLAALMSLAGARLVTDDVLRVVEGTRGWSCHRGASSLRLRPTSKAFAELASSVAERTADDRHLLSPEPTAWDRLPLDAVVFPRLRDPDHPLGLTRLEPKGAVFELLAFPRVYNWEDAPTSATHFAKLAELAELTPTYVLDVPWGVKVDVRFAEELTDSLFALAPAVS